MIKVNGKLSPILICENIVVSPAIELRHPDIMVGPVFPDKDWNEENIFRHYRKFRDGCYPVDKKPLISDEICETIDKTLNYGGVAIGHFGHFIADFCVNRIIPLLVEVPENPFLIILVRKNKDLNTWQREILFKILGIRKVEYLTDKPIRVKKLYIAPQIERLHCGILSESYKESYLDFLDENIKRLFGDINTIKGKKVFISRLNLPNRIIGESYLCELFSKLGYKIIFPEKISVYEQLYEYLTSELLVFTEGSSIHGLQLLGRLKDKMIVIINRRPNFRLGKELLELRCSDSKFYYIDAVKIKINGPLQKIPCILDPEVLVESFEKIDKDFSNTFNIKDFYRAILKDSVDILFHYSEMQLDLQTVEQLRELYYKAGLESIYKFFEQNILNK